MSNSMFENKKSFFRKLNNKMKNFFKVEPEISNEQVQEKSVKTTQNTFLDELKVQVDTEILTLKLKLDRGEIRAIDLTNEQIDKLQKIYDDEIKRKKLKLEKLKKSA